MIQRRDRSWGEVVAIQQLAADPAERLTVICTDENEARADYAVACSLFPGRITFRRP